MTTSLSRPHSAALAASIFLLLGLPTMGQTTNYIADQFQDDTSSTWYRWWGDAPYFVEWDPSVNAPTVMAANPEGSGSLKFTVDWSQPGADQYMLIHGFDGTQYGGEIVLNLKNYTNFSFDLRFDPSSATTSGGNSYGYLEPAFLPQGSPYPPIAPSGVTLPVTNGWIHVSLPLDPTPPTSTRCPGLG